MEKETEDVLANAIFGGGAVCIDTPAFVGVSISFVMILIIALITIVFLWGRIRSMDAKGVKKQVL